MEFNSLSVVYGKPSEMFLKDHALKQSIAADKKYHPDGKGVKASDQEKLLADEATETPQQMDNLLDFG